MLQIDIEHIGEALNQLKVRKTDAPVNDLERDFSIKVTDFKITIERFGVNAHPDNFLLMIQTVFEKQDKKFELLFSMLYENLKEEFDGCQNYFELFKTHGSNYRFVKEVIYWVGIYKKAMRFINIDSCLKLEKLLSPDIKLVEPTTEKFDTNYLESKNYGWVFRKNYFTDANEKLRTKEQIKALNTKFCEVKFEQKPNYYKFNKLGKDTHSFKLMVGKHGLVTGVGEYHESSLIEGEYKLGFTFDPHFGYPMLNGQLVKGCIRSVFPSRLKNAKSDTEYLQHQAKILEDDFKENIFGDWIKKCPNLKTLEFSNDLLDFLESQIFENEENSTKFERKHWDIFFHGYVADANYYKYDNRQREWVLQHTDKRIFDYQNINKEENPLKSPKPIGFLKVRQGVVFQFQFDLKDCKSKYKGFEITATNKKELLKTILIKSGVGAKRRIGLGYFEDL